jgi:hypothetical protein
MVKTCRQSIVRRNSARLWGEPPNLAGHLPICSGAGSDRVPPAWAGLAGGGGAGATGPCVPGGGLDPLMPHSMRRGDTSCGTVLTGSGGWASCPTEGDGYWSAPSSSALRALHANERGKCEHRSR